jgi:hypothetical protein
MLAPVCAAFVCCARSDASERAFKSRSKQIAGSGKATGKVAGKVKSSDAGQSSKLLVRAAEKVLQDARIEAQHVQQRMQLPNRQYRQQSQPKMLPSAAAAAVEAHSSKGALGTVLAQYKEAQAAWAQEKVC